MPFHDVKLVCLLCARLFIETYYHRSLCEMGLSASKSHKFYCSKFHPVPGEGSSGHIIITPIFASLQIEHSFSKYVRYYGIVICNIH